MRHMLRIWVVTLATIGSAFAQTPPAETPPAAVATAEPDDAVAHDELRALQAAMEEALNKSDLDGLLAHVDDTVVFTAMNAAVGRGKEGIRDYFNRMMVGPDKIVDSVKMDFIPDGLSVFYGPDVAVSTGSAPAHYVLTNGMNFEVNARWTATLVRRDGRWLVAAFHYSTNMFKNPVLDMQRKWLMIAGGGVALLLGVIGFFVGRRKA
jgi:uncharacterized protein (TIGR02246 family)